MSELMSVSMSVSMSDDWKTYRTRFLVRARQLTEPLTFTDLLGRGHSGKPGDYLVQSSGGLSRVAPQEIFEDVYVKMDRPESKSPFCSPAADQLLAPSRGENLQI